MRLPGMVGMSMQVTIPCPCTEERDPVQDCPVCNDTRKLVVQTAYDPKPIPAREFDHEAWIMDSDESGPRGFGKTTNQALQSLKEAIDLEYFS